MNRELDFFIYKKKCLINLINKCIYIIETYETLLDTDIYTDESQLYTCNINFYIREKECLQEKISVCDENINKLCNHKFIDDLVDFGLDSSAYIKRCTVCEYIEHF